MNSETNHSWWTLTKHVAHSVNNTAAKIDISIYSGKTNAVIVQSPKPASKPIDPNAPSGAAVALIAVLSLVTIGIILLRKIRY
jgi:capsular polysaccharide biosynthesis protein